MSTERVGVDRIEVATYTIPTDRPEADGTLAWDSTTLVTAHAHAGGRSGLGWTYTHRAAALLIADTLTDVVCGGDAFDVPKSWTRMNRQIRNLGRPGLGMMAISAVDVALWDLKARLLDASLFDLLGCAREAVPLYGSGGFTSYSLDELTAQLSGWVAQGIPRVKMKVGTHPDEDPARVRAARKAIGDDVELMVDANGAYGRKQALALAQEFAGQDVVWFEEPLPSADLDGLRLMRDRAPDGMAIAAGEYGWDAGYFRDMLQAGAVDILQADATRCGGYTGFQQVDALCRGFGIPLSAHCAPALHLPACCAARTLVHQEYFHDHVRIERIAFDGVPDTVGGALRPDRSAPGHGYALRAADIEPYRVCP
ncbi:MAG: enolase C-terminal domain-like protein [Rhodanobacteraceae bacterium]